MSDLVVLLYMCIYNEVYYSFAVTRQGFRLVTTEFKVALYVFFNYFCCEIQRLLQNITTVTPVYLSCYNREYYFATAR